jgi:hypothetical protein
MSERLFDIFSGVPDKTPVWMEAVQGLSNARERMEEIAEKAPGQYFVFSTGSQSVIVRTETFKRIESSETKNICHSK